MIKKLIPNFYYPSIYEMNLEEIYNSGIRLILTDLDNTLISYKETLPNVRIREWVKKAHNLGFEVIIVSNSRKTRVTTFAEALELPCVKFSTKPLKRGIKKAIYKVASKKYHNDEILLMGDQMMTDIFGGNRCKIKTVLIKPVDKKTDTFPTRWNRFWEKCFLKRIKRKMPHEYDAHLKQYVGDSYDN